MYKETKQGYEIHDKADLGSGRIDAVELLNLIVVSLIISVGMVVFIDVLLLVLMLAGMLHWQGGILIWVPLLINLGYWLTFLLKAKELPLTRLETLLLIQNAHQQRAATVVELNENQFQLERSPLPRQDPPEPTLVDRPIIINKPALATLTEQKSTFAFEGPGPRSSARHQAMLKKYGLQDGVPQVPQRRPLINIDGVILDGRDIATFLIAHYQEPSSKPTQAFWVKRYKKQRYSQNRAPREVYDAVVTFLLQSGLAARHRKTAPLTFAFDDLAGVCGASEAVARWVGQVTNDE
ncbi:MAG: hypothetical protein AAF629_00040 [Chloroflexota bacterium]